VSSGVPAGVMRQLVARRSDIDTALRDIASSVSDDHAVGAAMRYALETGGKRLRPVLCLAAADAVKPAAPQQLPARARAAAAIELIHTYSLVHDDLPCMDDDELRRGRPTTHIAFDTASAVLAGYALIPLACRVIDDAAAALELPADRRAHVVRELCRGAGANGMVGGQLLDLAGEGEALSVERLRRIHAMKTGALFVAAVRVGALLAGGDAHVVDALGRFGAGLGLAFQITDDVLDETMDAAALGKTPGKDRGAHKTTFSSLMGVEAARGAAVAEADAAVAAMRGAGVHSPFLESLAGFAVHRDR
jgi:geranylgeranyl pyrophosphate synthase